MSSDGEERLLGIDFDWHNPHSASKLSKAVKELNVNLVKKLIKQGASLDSPDNRGYTPLHEAAKYDAGLGIARTLLDAGAYIDHQTVELETPLFIACKHSSKNIVHLLLQHNCSVNLPNIDLFTPLHVACREGNLEIVQCLIRAGAELEKKDRTDCTPLFCAIQHDNVEIAKFLLESGANVNACDVFGRSPLHYMCGTSNINTFNSFIKLVGLSDSVINTKTYDGWTLLMEAVQNRDYNIVKQLIKYGAKTEMADCRGILALHIAAHSNSFECFKLILENTPLECIEKYSNKFMISDISTSLPCLLIDAMYKDTFDCFELLVKRGVSDDVLTCPAMVKGLLLTPLSFLVLSEDILLADKLKLLKSFVKYDILINTCYANHRKVVHALEAVLKLHIRDSHNDCCMCTSLMEILLEKGEDPDRDTKEIGQISTLFKKFLGECFIPGIRFLLRYSQMIEPEDLMLHYINEVVTGHQVTALSNQLLTDFFLSLGCDMSAINAIVAHEYYQASHSHSISQSICEKIICVQTVPPLKKLSRHSLRKQIHRETAEAPKQFFNALKSLKVPNVILGYLMLNDL